MKGFPKVLKTKEDYYNCLAMVASGELAAADLLAKIESAENQRYIECGVAAVEEEKKAVTHVGARGACDLVRTLQAQSSTEYWQGLRKG